MKIALLIMMVTSSLAMATPMRGFGSYYYLDNPPLAKFITKKDLAPDIVIGGRRFIMETSQLADIAQQTGVLIHHDTRSSWVCLGNHDIEYWFISDNEMGKGGITSIAISRTEEEKGCAYYHGSLDISIKDIPILNASSDVISSTFLHIPANGITQFCSETKSYSDFTQMNCLNYYMKNKKAYGVLISQITSN